MGKYGDMTCSSRLVLSLDRTMLAEFFPMLQQGVVVPARVGCSLMELLCGEFNLGREYVTERITTVFLDCRAIDDLEKTVVHDGSQLALSAAMPGLVGATMRRGGYYAAMRSAMSHRDASGKEEERNGTVRVKLFNLLLNELGPLFLGRGIFLAGSTLTGLLEKLENGVAAAELDNGPVSIAELRDHGFSEDATILFSVVFRD